MSAFRPEREFLVDLPCCYAGNVLRLLENGTTPADAPIHLRVPLTFAQRCPDIARYFLVQKMQAYESI